MISSLLTQDFVADQAFDRSNEVELEADGANHTNNDDTDRNLVTSVRDLEQFRNIAVRNLNHTNVHTFIVQAHLPRSP